jgi:hypothetical protein
MTTRQPGPKIPGSINVCEITSLRNMGMIKTKGEPKTEDAYLVLSLTDVVNNLHLNRLPMSIIPVSVWVSIYEITTQGKSDNFYRDVEKHQIPQCCILQSIGLLILNTYVGFNALWYTKATIQLNRKGVSMELFNRIIGIIYWFSVMHFWPICPIESIFEWLSKDIKIPIGWSSGDEMYTFTLIEKIREEINDVVIMDMIEEYISRKTRDFIVIQKTGPSLTSPIASGQSSPSATMNRYSPTPSMSSPLDDKFAEFRLESPKMFRKSAKPFRPRDTTSLSMKKWT